MPAMAATQAPLRRSSIGSSRKPWSNRARARLTSKWTSPVKSAPGGGTGLWKPTVQPNLARSSEGRYVRPFPASSRTSLRILVSCSASPSVSAYSAARAVSGAPGTVPNTPRESRPMAPATQRQ